MLCRLEMGNLPRPLAGAERSDGRPTVGRLEPSKGLLVLSHRRTNKSRNHPESPKIENLLQLCAGIGRNGRAGPNALWTCSSFPENDE